MQVLSNVLAQEFQHVWLVRGYVFADSWAESQGDNARDAGTELKDSSGRRQESAGGKEVGGGGDPIGEEGSDSPDCCD